MRGHSFRPGQRVRVKADGQVGRVVERTPTGFAVELGRGRNIEVRVFTPRQTEPAR